ncbi:MAG: hypothetical protein AAFR84_06585 [Pseudomonadota bacterium]
MSAKRAFFFFGDEACGCCRRGCQVCALGEEARLAALTIAAHRNAYQHAMAAGRVESARRLGTAIHKLEEEAHGR